MQHLRFREAAVSDLPDVENLSRQWVRENNAWGLVPTPTAFLHERIGPCFHVAQAPEGVIGYAFGRIYLNDERAVFPASALVFELEEMYVVPNLRRRGIGGALLDRVLAAARLQGVRHFLVCSAARPIDPVVQFYRSRGFEPWSVQMFRSDD